VSVGLPAIRVVGRQFKPTSSLLRILSPWIKKNRVKLTQSQALGIIVQREHKLSSRGTRKGIRFG
jgi:hypothetical protein